MNIKKTIINPTRVSLQVDVDEQLLAQQYKKTIKKLSTNLNLPGFRKGLIPEEVAIKNLDQKLVEAEFLDQTIDYVYRQSIVDQKLNPVSMPEVKLKAFVLYTKLQVVFDFDVIGPIKLPDLRHLVKKPTKPSVSDQEINDFIENYRISLAERKPVFRALKKGDEAEFNFKGFNDQGHEIQGASAEHYQLVIGSKKFIPGFEDQLVGLKPNDQKSFVITFPKDYFEASLQGAKVKFDVKINQVNSLILPKIDENFLKKIGPFNNLDDFKKAIEQQILEEKNREQDQTLKDQLIAILVEKTAIEIPESLIKQEVDHFMLDLEKKLSDDQQTIDQFLKSQNMSLDEYKASRQDLIIKQIKVGLILAEIAQNEKITVSEEEFNQTLNQLKQIHQQDQAMIKELNDPNAQQDLRNRILIEKILDYLIEKS